MAFAGLQRHLFKRNHHCPGCAMPASSTSDAVIDGWCPVTAPSAAVWWRVRWADQGDSRASPADDDPAPNAGSVALLPAPASGMAFAQWRRAAPLAASAARCCAPYHPESKREARRWRLSQRKGERARRRQRRGLCATPSVQLPVTAEAAPACRAAPGPRRPLAGAVPQSIGRRCGARFRRHPPGGRARPGSTADARTRGALTAASSVSSLVRRSQDVDIVLGKQLVGIASPRPPLATGASANCARPVMRRPRTPPRAFTAHQNESGLPLEKSLTGRLERPDRWSSVRGDHNVASVNVRCAGCDGGGHQRKQRRLDARQTGPCRRRTKSTGVSKVRAANRKKSRPRICRNRDRP